VAASLDTDPWQYDPPARPEQRWTVRLALSNPDDDAGPWARRVVAELVSRSATAATLPGWIELTLNVEASSVWSVPSAVAELAVVEQMGACGWTVDWLEVLSAAAFEAELDV
jgi:hypothetical protein